MTLKKLFIVLLVCLFAQTAFSQAAISCEPVVSAKQMGESISFYIYSFQTNKFNEVLRISSVYKVTYNFDPKARVDHGAIAIRFGREFNYFVRGLSADDSKSPNGVASSTQNKGIFMCMNREAVAEHRIQKMEEFEKWDKQIFQEEAFNFEYKFNTYYKASTVVTASKM
jgi:hypothetical protein